MGLSPVGASHLPYLRTEVAWSALSGLNPALWTGTQGVALGARNAPLGLNTTAHLYCTGRIFLALLGFLWVEIVPGSAVLARSKGL